MEFQGRKRMELGVKSRCLKLRTLLKNSLKEQFPNYIAAVVEWIRMRKSRAELDMQVFIILEESIRKAHFGFLVCLSKLCWGISSLRIETSIPSVTSYWSPSKDSQPQRLRAPQDTDNQDKGVLFKKTYTDLSLPGVELIQARLYLAAWDAGISNVDSKVSRLLHIAMRHYVKDIIHAAYTYKDASTAHRTKSAQVLSIWWALKHTNCDRPAIQYSSAFDQGRRDDLKTL